MTLSTPVLAKKLGISRQRVNELGRLGKIARERNGEWDLDKVEAALKNNLDTSQVSPARDRIPQARSAGPVLGSLSQAQLMKAQATAAQETMIARKMEGSLLPAEDVRKAWSGHIAGVKNSLLLLAPRVAPKLAAIDDVHQVGAILDGEVRRILSELSSA